MVYIRPQVLRTREALSGAIVQLLLERGYDRLTVRAVTDHAKVGYATFFRRFPSLDALIDYVCETATLELCRRLGEQGTLRDEAITLYRFIEVYDKPFRAYMSLPGWHSARRVATNIMAQYIQCRYEPPDSGQVPLAVWTNHVIETVYRLLHWYLNHMDDYGPEQMADIHINLIARSSPSAGLALREDWLPSDIQYQLDH